jgi:hypothetical protein
MSARKGIQAEEAIRLYFLAQGSFAIRSVIFAFDNHPVTDIDLLLYQRTSLVTRERINVDIKRKKSAQSFERIVWAKGLQNVLGFERSFVVTSDKRDAIERLGALSGVMVFDGDFLQSAISHYAEQTERIWEEELEGQLNTPLAINSSTSYRRKYTEVKMHLLQNFNFNGVNLILDEIHILFHELSIIPSGREGPVTRLLYICIAYLLITLDFVLYPYAHAEQEKRSGVLLAGLMYGEAGEQRAREILSVISQIIPESFRGNVALSLNNMQQVVDGQFQERSLNALAEYLSRADVSRKLFAWARKFEWLAYQPDLVKPSGLDSEERAILGVFLDFFKIDRRLVL